MTIPRLLDLLERCIYVRIDNEPHLIQSDFFPENILTLLATSGKVISFSRTNNDKIPQTGNTVTLLSDEMESFEVTLMLTSETFQLKLL